MTGQFLRILGSRRRLADGLVRRVAEQSVPAVSRVVGNRTAGMSPCEARGYIRARAGVEVRRQARTAQTLDLVPVMPEAALVARATERVVAQVMRQLVVKQLISRPAAEACTRAAA